MRVSSLLYVLLDGFDLGVGILFGLARGEQQRRAMQGAVSPIWDGNETWLVVPASSCGAPSRWSMRRSCPHSTFRYLSCWQV